MNFDLKNFLKNLKLNENNISTVLGALVIVIVGILVVNYFKDKRADTLTGLNTQNQIGGEHVVVKGETLWSIAEDTYGSGYNWMDLVQANGLTTDKIEVGQKLTLPDVPAAKPTSTKVAVTGQPAQSVSGDTYTVVRGDSLWKIAVSEYGDGGRWVDLAKVNNLVNPNLIHAGNVLTLPR